MSNLDLRDVVGSDTKLENFMCSKKVKNNLLDVPKLSERDVWILKEANVKTTNDLIGVFASLDFNFKRCVDFMKNLGLNSQCKHAVVTIFVKLNEFLEMPRAPDNWRSF